MIKKEMLLKALEGFPEEFTLDDLIDQAILLKKIEAGLSQSEKGEVVSHEEAKRRLKKSR